MTNLAALLPLKLAFVKWRKFPSVSRRDIPFPLVLETWDETEPLVPLGRIAERVAIGEATLPSPAPPHRHPVTSLPFSIYLS